MKNLQAAAPSGTRALRLVTGPVAQHAFPDKAEMPLSLRQCLHMRNTAAHGYLGFALALDGRSDQAIDHI